MYKILTIILCLGVLSSCCPGNFDTSMKKVYVDKVYMNETSRYTFITKGESEDIVWQINTHDPSLIHIYSDVSKDEIMYVEYCKKCFAGDASHIEADPAQALPFLHQHNP